MADRDGSDDAAGPVAPDGRAGPPPGGAAATNGDFIGKTAHEFNNLLSIVIGNLYLLSEQVGDVPEHAELCAEALEAAGRAAELTRVLAAFGAPTPP